MARAQFMMLLALALGGASAWQVPKLSKLPQLHRSPLSSKDVQAAPVTAPAKYSTALEAATATAGGESEAGGLAQTLKVGGYFGLWVSRELAARPRARTSAHARTPPSAPSARPATPAFSPHNPQRSPPPARALPRLPRALSPLPLPLSLPPLTARNAKISTLSTLGTTSTTRRRSTSSTCRGPWP